MNLPGLLRELHAEKCWLDDLIGSLEIAARSPVQRFASALIDSMAEVDGPILCLPGRKKEELVRLARLVTREERTKARHQRRFGPALMPRHRQGAAPAHAA